MISSSCKEASVHLEVLLTDAGDSETQTIADVSIFKVSPALLISLMKTLHMKLTVGEDMWKVCGGQTLC